MKTFPIKSLIRADYNPRIMPDHEMAFLMDSIKTHGFVEPIVVNIHKERYGVIVGGHQRLIAVEKLLASGIVPKGIEMSHSDFEAGIHNQPTIPIYEVDLDLEAEKQLNIGLNKIHGKFDEDKLYDLLFPMKDSSTLPTTGFAGEELADLLNRGEKKAEVDQKKGRCPRCIELENSIEGHTRRSGHNLKLPKHDDDK